AAAVPKPTLDALAQRLAAAGLRLSRLDAALLCWWRQLANQQPSALAEGRCAVLFEQGGEWDLLVSEGGEPLLARGLGVPFEPQDLAREITLSLVHAELEATTAPLRSLLVVSEQPPDKEWLSAMEAATALKPVHVPRECLGPPGLGVALRADEAGRLDLIPAAWRTQESALRIRRRFIAGLGVAALLWVVLAAVLMLAPWSMQQWTARLKARMAAREPAYRAASDVRLRVRLIRTYMDRSRSLLEVLRGVCAEMPQGIDLSSVNYTREEGVKLVGDAADPALVYAFKDAIDASGVFRGSQLSGPTLNVARRRHTFEIDARFAGGEE
ncbi:MAG: hypothetical protein PHR35_17235, partial [Kiritimatiellae bacterium]|nr:hypothetical protein [Kiritimatiellia bacterium]